MNDVLWITEAEVASLIDMSGAIAALERGLALEAQGAAVNMVKTHATWGGGDTLHAIGATFAGEGVVGTKTWAHTEGGAAPVLILFDSHNGSLKAVIEAFALGQLRTAGISGLATRWLAAEDASDMALLGAGKQAMAQLAAVAAVRTLRSVRVFSRSRERASKFAQSVEAELGLSATAFDSVPPAVEGASLITLATRATEPILTGAMVARGAHINAIGAVVPERIEFEPRLLARCARVVADSVPQVRTLSREFMDYYGNDESAWKSVTPLNAVIAGRLSRPAGADLTLFKAMGMGISDLSLGVEVLRRAGESGLGRPIPHPVRGKPRLRVSKS
jgi:alanine dehydrogenase